MTEEQKMQERERIGQRFADVRKETEWVDDRVDDNGKAIVTNLK